MACPVAFIVPFSVTYACNCAAVRRPGLGTAAVARAGRHSRPSLWGSPARAPQPAACRASGGRSPSHISLLCAVHNLSLCGGQEVYSLIQGRLRCLQAAQAGTASPRQPTVLILQTIHVDRVQSQHRISCTTKNPCILKSGSEFLPIRMPASFEISIKLVVCLGSEFAEKLD